jgi:hypothetical protein
MKLRRNHQRSVSLIRVYGRNAPTMADLADGCGLSVESGSRTRRRTAEDGHGTRGL